MKTKSLLQSLLLMPWLLGASLAAVPVSASAQAVFFPQAKQPGTARVSEADGVITLGNDLLNASFVNKNNKLTFGGCPELNLESGTELFTITLGDETTTIPASEMTLTDWGHKQLSGNPNATVASEKIDGQAVYATLTYGDLEFEWQAILRDGSHYIRTTLAITAKKNVAMHNIIPMTYNIPAELAPAVVGNTRGAILASDKIFAGLETPTGYNSVASVGSSSADDFFAEDEGFSYNSWSKDTSGDSQPSEPLYWTWVPGKNTPDAIQAFKFTPSNTSTSQTIGTSYARGKRGFVKFDNSGNHTVTFKYVSGTHGLNVVGVDVMNADGEIIASDYHIGFTGGMSRNNVYTLNIPQAGTYLVRYFVEIGTETITADGTITWSPAVSAGTKPATTEPGEPEEKALRNIIGRWSRHTTLEAGKTWNISAVVGLIAPNQARRSVLAYSERERAVPWRAFAMYNSWYELGIDRNNSPTYANHATSQECLNVVNQWRTHLYDQYKTSIKSFLWDDGWDEYGTWTFNKNFPNGFTEPDAAAVEMNSGTGGWLGPVGGYGNSGNLRRQYWANKGGMQLSNPAYYKVFLDACKYMIDNYNFNCFKLDGISAQFSSVGPDAGYTGEENAEGIIDIISQVRKMRPDMFFNTTVGTWASPFWFHYTDAVWRQEADWQVAGNQGDDRERWITYRDRLVYQNFVTNSPLCPINTIMNHGFILTENGAVSKTMDYDGIVRELRCAFACGSGLVELYADSKLLNNINGGALWGDIAECIKWQEKNADVLPDIHWVGGNPWDGSKANVYGWASWNGTKATLALRNPATTQATFTFTLREALDMPDYQNSPVYFSPAFEVQDELAGLATYTAINPDATITVTLPGSSVFVFDGSTTSVNPPADNKYAVMVETPQHGTLTVYDASTETPVVSGKKYESGTMFTVEAKPAYGYKLTEVTLNDVTLEGDNFILEEEAVTVRALFERDPDVPVIYTEPSGNTRDNTYVEHIYSTGAKADIDVNFTSLPDEVYTLVDQTISVTPGSTVTLNLQAKSLGEGSTTTVYQDLRYDAAYIFADVYGTGEFILLTHYGNLPPTHNVYGNYDEVMNIAHEFTVPTDLEEGSNGRIRIIYANAWTVPGKDAELRAASASYADCDPNSQYITDGVAYDLPFVVVEESGIADITADDAAAEYFNLQGQRVNAAALSPGIYIKRCGTTARKVLINR